MSDQQFDFCLQDRAILMLFCITFIWWFADTCLVIKTPFKPIQAFALKQLLKMGSQILVKVMPRPKNLPKVLNYLFLWTLFILDGLNFI